MSSVRSVFKVGGVLHKVFYGVKEKEVVVVGAVAAAKAIDGNKEEVVVGPAKTVEGEKEVVVVVGKAADEDGEPRKEKGSKMKKEVKEVRAAGGFELVAK